MINAIYIDPKQAAPIIRATFPSYNGKHCKIRAQDRVTFNGLNWSGGSRSTYRACRLDGTPIESQHDMSAPPPWSNPFEGKTVSIPAGCAVVEHSIFCGKDMGLTIYAPPADVAPLLPAPVELDPFAALVLKYTVERKSSYNGHDRYQMAETDSRYSFRPEGEPAPTFPTREQWETAKADLIARGFLNKSGAVTIAGRNAHKR